MVFSSTITERTIMGNKKVYQGTYDCTGVTGGDIDTGLTVCQNIKFTQKGAAVTLNAPVVNETLPVAGNAVTIITDSGAAGYWEASGY